MYFGFMNKTTTVKSFHEPALSGIADKKALCKRSLKLQLKIFVYWMEEAASDPVR